MTQYGHRRENTYEGNTYEECCMVPAASNGIKGWEYSVQIPLNKMQNPHASKSKVTTYVPSYDDNDILFPLTFPN